MKVAPWSVLVALIVVCSGCSTGEPATSAAPKDEAAAASAEEVSPAASLPAVDTQRPALVDVPASPLEEAFGLLVDAELLSEAYEIAYRGFASDVTLCMRRAGYEYTERSLPVPPPDDFRRVRSVGELASIYDLGYVHSLNLLRGLDSSNGEPLPEDAITLQNRTTFQSLSREDKNIFRGIRSDCREQAGEQNPIPDDFESAIGDEIAEVRTAAMNSAAMREVWLDWSLCIAKEGLTFPDRSALAASLEQDAFELFERQSQEGASPALVNDTYAFAEVEERLVAFDIACSEQIQLLDRARDVVDEFETAWLKDNGDRVNLLLQQRDSGEDP